MKSVVGICLLALASAVVASPHVTGFERFHNNKPSVDGGALLFSELGCANCHGGSPAAVPRKGPSLENLSSRVDYHWVLEFLAEPEEGRKGSTMPGMMHGMSDDEVKAVVAYLSTLGKGLNLKAARHANAELGSALYHEKGCVACHAPTDDYRGPAGGAADLTSSFAVSLPDLKEKTSLVALEHFLLNAGKYRPDGRMPHMDLGRDGAINVAAHLLDIQGSDPREAKIIAPWPKAKGDQVKRGRALVEKMACVSCHDTPGVKMPELVSLKPEPRADDHCFSDKPKKGRPYYPLTEIQRKSLEAYLSNSDEIKIDETSMTLKAMNCYACHHRDGLGGPSSKIRHFFHGNESLGDSGKLPPPLSGIGHKLRKDWLVGVLSGDQARRVRPYLQTLMPAYPNQANALAECFEKADVKPDAKPLVDLKGKLEQGRKLLGTQGGVNCITCHHWGENQSVGIPGPDLASLGQRLRPEWFRSYLLDPASYRPGTLMPSLWPEGKSTIPDILEGDTEKQIAAIWEFIEKGKKVPEGFPDRSGRQFELKPTDRPIVQRAFMNGAGTKAILVGFPGNIHLAYDGDEARPAMVWRGAFFDPYSTWFMRMAPFEKPLSDEVYSFADLEEERRFRGYELDEKGVPIFLFSESGRLMRERFEVGEGRMTRILSWEEGGAPKVTHPKGVEVEQKQEGEQLTVIYRWK